MVTFDLGIIPPPPPLFPPFPPPFPPALGQLQKYDSTNCSLFQTTLITLIGLKNGKTKAIKLGLNLSSYSNLSTFVIPVSPRDAAAIRSGSARLVAAEKIARLKRAVLEVARVAAAVVVVVVVGSAIVIAGSAVVVVGSAVVVVGPAVVVVVVGSSAVIVIGSPALAVAGRMLV
jgi:hypothetical protein